ncbi:putative leucine Rich Repeat family protein [Paratrimastix pyriformis]|uniref:Leucine Rich Repeat family protein n=1 Tax=Paratrimastix pyriformis TaxID=342808 RepID=A0ABQ8UD39_9EUKA|nr:putative leucine Rich Repeat family protein [Paratrimastix pyriformis]
MSAPSPTPDAAAAQQAPPPLPMVLPQPGSRNWSPPEVDDKTILGLKAQLQPLQSITFRDCRKITDQAIAHLIHECQNLASLELFECTKLSDESLVGLGKNARLEHLIFSGSPRVSDSALGAFVAPNLTTLSIEKCSAITDAGVGALVSGVCGPRLTHLSLAGCEKLMDACFAPVAEKCTNLQCLDLTRCEKISDAALAPLTNPAAGPMLTHLTTLILQDCIRVTSTSLTALPTSLKVLKLRRNEALSEAALGQLAAQCPQLEELHLCSFTNLAIANGRFPALKVLNLSNCVYLRSTDIGANAPNLQSVDLTNCRSLPDVGTVSFSNCLSLRVFTARNCALFSDLGLRPIIEKCSQLVHLDISYTDVGETGLIDVGTRLPDLEALYAEGLKATDSGISALVATLGNLRRLSIAHCSDVTDGAIQHIATHCPKLIHLDARCIRRVNDLAMNAIANNLSSLCYLDVRSPAEARVSDASVIQLASKCTLMQTLELGGHAVGDNSLNQLGNHCPCLERVGVHGTRVTPGGARTLVTKVPACRVVPILCAY